MTKHVLTFLLGAVIVMAAAALASAQPAANKSETEYLVPPQGGAFEIPVHAGAVCILSFPEKLSTKAITSSPDYEIKGWGDDGVAVRSIGNSPKPTTLALATSSGTIKVNVTLTVVASKQPAFTLVRFKAASVSAAFEAQVAAEVDKRMAPIRDQLARSKQGVDAQIRDRADKLLAQRMLRRNEQQALASHERNDDHVIVHVRRGQLLGEDGYLLFEIENRSSSAYRLASVRVTAAGRDVSGPAEIQSTAVDRDPSVIGVVAAGATARGIVTVRSVDTVLGKPLTLELAQPAGGGVIRLTRDLVLR